MSARGANTPTQMSTAQPGATVDSRGKSENGPCGCLDVTAIDRIFPAFASGASVLAPPPDVDVPMA